MKYTFIVPVYNGEKYIDRCLESLLTQIYPNFEIIAINDGSKDASKDILDDYQKNYDKVKIFHQENKGLSATRNLGIKKATGDYILFIDVDDYISSHTLSFIEAINKNSADLIKINWSSKAEDLNLKLGDPETLSGAEALIKLINQKKVFEMATIYAYRRDFLIKNNIYFKENRYHEDFGLIPITILKATEVILANRVMYYYDQNVIGSIMNATKYEVTRKKAFDVLEYYKEIKEELNKIKNVNPLAIELLNSFNANAVLNKRKTLNNEDRKCYDLEIIKLKILDNLYAKNFKSKIKKIIYKKIIKEN